LYRLVFFTLLVRGFEIPSTVLRVTVLILCTIGFFFGLG
jgi:hypothetical protein